MDIDLADRIDEDAVGGSGGDVIVALGVIVAVGIYPFFRRGLLEVFERLDDCRALGESGKGTVAVDDNTFYAIVFSGGCDRACYVAEDLYVFVDSVDHGHEIEFG